MEQYGPTSNITWFPYGDTTPAALAMDAGGDAGRHAPTPEQIEGGGVGGIQVAVVLRSSGHQDYGSGFGDYGFVGFSSPACGGPDGGTPVSPATYVDASPVRRICPSGARNPRETTKGLTLELTDLHSDDDPCATNVGCVHWSADARVSDNPSTGGTGTVQPGSSVGSAWPPANACGNFPSASTVILTSGNWQLYTIPFSSFHQAFQPDKSHPVRVRLSASIARFTNSGSKKEAVVDLWITNLGFYRTKRPDGGQ